MDSASRSERFSSRSAVMSKCRRVSSTETSKRRRVSFTTETLRTRRKAVFRESSHGLEVRLKDRFLRALSVSVVIVSPASQPPDLRIPRKIQTLVVPSSRRDLSALSVSVVNGSPPPRHQNLHVARRIRTLVVQRFPCHGGRRQAVCCLARSPHGRDGAAALQGSPPARGPG